MRNFICQFLIVFAILFLLTACENTPKLSKVDSVNTDMPVSTVLKTNNKHPSCPCTIINGNCPCNIPVHLGLEVDHGSGGFKSLYSLNNSSYSSKDSCYIVNNNEIEVDLTGRLFTNCKDKSKISILVRLLENDTAIAPSSIYYEKESQFTSTQNAINNSRFFFTETDFNPINSALDTCGAPFINKVIFNPKQDGNKIYKKYKIRYEILGHNNHSHSKSVLVDKNNAQAKQVIGPNKEKEKELPPIDPTHQHIYEFSIPICN